MFNIFHTTTHVSLVETTEMAAVFSCIYIRGDNVHKTTNLMHKWL